MNILASYTHLTDGELERWRFSTPDDTGARDELLRRAMGRGFHLEEDIKAAIANAADDHYALEQSEACIKDLEEERDNQNVELEDANKRISELTRIVEEAGLV